MLQGAFAVPHPPVILPEVGKGKEREIQKTTDAFNTCAEQLAALRPETIILISPHSVCYADYIHISPGKSARGDLGRFGASEINISVNYDAELAFEIERLSSESGIKAGMLGEKSAELDHGTLVPLYFINKYYKEYNLVRIGISGLSNAEHYNFGKIITKAAIKLSRKIAIIASGDLSHKLPEPDGAKLDGEITGALGGGDFLRLLQIPPELSENGAECGLRSFIIMAGALDKTALTPKLLSYEGTFGVGYAVASFIPNGAGNERDFLERYELFERIRMEEVRSNENEYVKIARLSAEHYVRTGSVLDFSKITGITPESIDKLLASRAGVFVCIKKHGQLRGCIGTISPVTESVGHEILRNAVSAASEDPRFEPVNTGELSELTYSVDVLAPPEKINDISQLDVARYGVIVTSGYKRGLLLPNLDGIDTAERQVSIAKQKAGIRGDETVKLERFEVVRYE